MSGFRPDEAVPEQEGRWTVYRQDDNGNRFVVQEHVSRTGSPLGESVLAEWDDVQSRFVKVMPHDYRAALERHHDHPVSAGGHGLFTRESETEEAA